MGCTAAAILPKQAGGTFYLENILQNLRNKLPPQTVKSLSIFRDLRSKLCTLIEPRSAVVEKRVNLTNISLKKSLGVPSGFDGHGSNGNDGIVDINDVELTLAPTYFGSERVRVRHSNIFFSISIICQYQCHLSVCISIIQYHYLVSRRLW